MKNNLEIVHGDKFENSGSGDQNVNTGIVKLPRKEDTSSASIWNGVLTTVIAMIFLWLIWMVGKRFGLDLPF